MDILSRRDADKFIEEKNTLKNHQIKLFFSMKCLQIIQTLRLLNMIIKY